MTVLPRTSKTWPGSGREPRLEIHVNSFTDHMEPTDSPWGLSCTGFDLHSGSSWKKTVVVTQGVRSLHTQYELKKKGE